jgi:alkylation response protein AidB-like acyl-CoA dehydrogenase
MAGPGWIGGRSDAGSTTSSLSSGRAAEVQARVRALARGRFAERADDYDRRAAYPVADFEDLRAAGLHAPVLPIEDGGLGFGPVRGDAFALWMMTKELGRANLALSRVWEAHVNATVLLDAMATPEQRERFIPGIVERGERWSAWSGEPLVRVPGQRADIGTQLRRVEGGWVVRGSKVFCSGAGAIRWAILLVNLEGAGGVRHATGAIESSLALICDLTDPSVSFDSSWWDPIGMRATVSYLTRFDDTFIPDANLLGEPGSYLRDDWQARFVPHYAASFLGAATAAFDYALEHIDSTGRAADPYVQQRVARMAMNLDSADLWLHHVARLWDAGRIDEAKHASSRARYVVEAQALAVVDDAVHVCGARGLIRPSRLERIVRDLTFYSRHDSDDQILATVGRGVLGLRQDLSFHR